MYFSSQKENSVLFSGNAEKDFTYWIIFLPSSHRSTSLCFTCHEKPKQPLTNLKSQIRQTAREKIL